MTRRTGSVAAATLLLSAMACSAADSAGGAAGALGSTWADAEKMPDFFTGMWMTRGGMVESDEKLNPPYTPQAQKYADAYVYKRDIPYAQDGCASPGLPIAMRTGPIKFTYAPGMISIYMQAVGHTRFIRLNQPMGKTAPKYYGNSVGHWEGDTLVVETADFLPEISFQYGVGEGLQREATIGTATIGGAPAVGPASAAGPAVAAGPAGPAGGPPRGPSALSRAIWGPHGEQMRMVERMRVVDGSLEVQLTIQDETVWTKPFVAKTHNFRRIQKGISERGPFSGEPEEWVCTVSITSFDPDTNTYQDKDPEDMVKYLDKLGR